ncbi:MAG: helix-turn-helix domain-containing protein [Candidatus Microbacterium colombiense]|nr:MAG: helix-turn-helix domain-containing protein [Microbacterium sp.]
MATNAAPVAATWISVRQAADLMSCSTKTVRRLIARGALPARRIGTRMIRIDSADLDALGRNLTVARA